nr:hypothetical protein [Mycoplasmopsis bovis]
MATIWTKRPVILSSEKNDNYSLMLNLSKIRITRNEITKIE